MHRAVRQERRKLEELQKTVGRDTSCEENLSKTQDGVRRAEDYYSNAFADSQKDPTDDKKLGAAWTAWDWLGDSRLAFFHSQKKCAPRNSKAPAPPRPPPVCNETTGGTCGWLWCYAFRQHAYCNETIWACLCSAGYCSNSEGVCKSRGPLP